MKNRDRESYKDNEALQRERLNLLIRKHNGGSVDENELHAHDLLSAKIRDEYYRKHVMSNIMIKVEEDDQFEILYKYYETLHIINRKLDDLYEKLTSYQEDQQFAEKIVARHDQIRNSEDEIKRLEEKTLQFSQGVDQVKKIVKTLQDNQMLQDLLNRETPDNSALIEQQQKNKNTEDVKISPKIMMSIKQTDQMIDKLSNEVRRTNEFFSSFLDEFPEIYIKDTEKQKQTRINKEKNKRLPPELASAL